MKKHGYIPFLGLLLSLIFNSWNVGANDATTPADPERQLYHRFLPPVPKGSYYDTRLKEVANIDDTPENETIVSILEDGGMGSVFDGNWVRAYLLILTTDTREPEKKELFELFDVTDHDADVSLKSIEPQPPPFIFSEYPRDADKPHRLPFRLIDLTGDGVLDIWVEAGYAVAVISFQNGEFQEIFGSYAYTDDQRPEYIDMDTDGSYEIKIPHRVYLDGFIRSAHPIWMSLFEWDADETVYVLNNAKFYVQDTDIFFRLLSAYNDHLRLQYDYQQALAAKDPGWTHRATPIYIQKVDPTPYFEIYDFFIGLIHYYRDELPQAQAYLQRVATEAKHHAYLHAADAVLREIWNATEDKVGFVEIYREYLTRRHGDIAEVDIFIAGKKKMLSGSFSFPADATEFLMFYEAKYALWPNETVRRELEKVRKAKAEGTPFPLIDWSDE